MPMPEWADPQLSKDLPRLRALGESQTLEYMVAFPQQARELAKEIAAFAGTNPGIILLGVANDGSLVGLTAMDCLEARDELLRRMEGLCRGTIKPAITPSVTWAIEDGHTVLVIQVPKGSEPIYYSNNIPYVRHLSESRPAEPHEVVDRCRAMTRLDTLAAAASGVEPQDHEPSDAFMSEFASLLIDALIAAEEADERAVNPWLSLWRAQYEYTASRLREIATERTAVTRGIGSELEELAKALDEVAGFQLYFGCGPKFSEVKQHAASLLREAKQKHVDSIPVSRTSLSEARDVIEKTSRQLNSLVERMAAMAHSGRLEELQSEVSQHGLVLLQLGHYNLDPIQVGLSQRLHAVGHGLHLVETMRISLDGGRSVQAVLDRVKQGASELASVAASLGSS